METIVKAGIKNESGEVFVGNSHGDIIREVYLKTGDMLSAPFARGVQEGFVTSEGRFVSRIEAGIIALKSGQIKEEVKALCSYMLNLDSNDTKTKN